MKYILYLALGVIATSCFMAKSTDPMKEKIDTKMNEGEKIILVNSLMVNCMGVAPMKCLQIKEIHEGVTQKNWTLFYDEIDGFTFEPGHVYKLKIKEIKLDPKEVPADASTIRRTLIEVLKKTKVTTSLIDGEWVAISIRGIEEKLVLQASPFIILNQGKVSGYDGCNRLFSSYQTSTNSIEFTTFGSTKMACSGEGLNIVSNGFYKALEATSSFKMEGSKLIFLNKSKETILSFIKK